MIFCCDVAEALWLAACCVRTQRHGCVLNLKRLKVTADVGAPHVCMSKYMWDNVYGLEDATTAGESITPAIVGSARRR